MRSSTVLVMLLTVTSFCFPSACTISGVSSVSRVCSSVILAGCTTLRVVGGCVLVYARAHTQATLVLNVSPGVRLTPGELEESSSTKAQYKCRPYTCAQYICVFICWAAGFDDLG